MSDALANQTIVITGASDGIGRVAAQRLAAAGANVVMVGRNAAKTEAAALAIMSENGRRNVSWEIADLSNLHDVRDLAERLNARLDKIDVLINNAGAIFAQRTITADGFERTFALNHLAYFALTLLLLPKIRAAATAQSPARIIIVSSEAHRRAKFNIDDLQSERSFRPWRAYSNSKLENLLFMRELAERFTAINTNVRTDIDTDINTGTSADINTNARTDIDAEINTSTTADINTNTATNTNTNLNIAVNALHPGLVSSRFAVTGNGKWGRVVRWLMNLRSISPSEGADTIVWLATNAEVAHTSGGYWIRRTLRTPSAAAQREDFARELWERSAQLTNIDADAVMQDLSQGLAQH